MKTDMAFILQNQHHVAVVERPTIYHARSATKKDSEIFTHRHSFTSIDTTVLNVKERGRLIEKVTFI